MEKTARSYQLLGRDTLEWYVLRTLCGKEDIVLDILKKIEKFAEFDVFCPQKKVRWRKKGCILDIVKPLFAGYLFVAIHNEEIEKFYRLLNMYKINMVKLVRNAGSIVPISIEEKQILQRLMDCERIVEVSKFEIIEEQLRVIEGPLIGCEHMIKKISNRNRRITIEIPILEEKKNIDLEGILVNFKREKQ